MKFREILSFLRKFREFRSLRDQQRYAWILFMQTILRNGKEVKPMEFILSLILQNLNPELD